jgi:thioredoxin reductase (NADPH)
MVKSNAADVLIVGAGPAGLSAATWCTELGLGSIVLESSDEIGGQLHKIYAPIENYIGARAESGAAMLALFRRSVEHFSLNILTRVRISKFDLTAKSVELANGGKIVYGCLIIATGVRRRWLGVPGEIELAGKGILESGMRDRDRVAGRSVVIVGGGDAAVENALILSELAERVTLIHRRDKLRARDEFVRQIGERPNIDLRLETRVTKILGDDTVTGVVLEGGGLSTSETLPADRMLIRIGVDPNSELVKDAVRLDERGYIVVDARGETSHEGIFAVGDVANPGSLTISTAAGTGATAAQAAYRLVKARDK